MHPAGLPLTLSRLHGAREGAEREGAWADFLSVHSEVVLHACTSVTRDHDAAMDAYLFVLEALRADDWRRLRAYVPDGKTKFTTWLVVVTRRLVLDFLRQRYGRSRSSEAERRDEQITRRNLEDLVAAEIDPDHIEDAASNSPEARIRRTQLTDALRTAMAALEPADRLLLAMRFVDDRPVREIARALGAASVFHIYRRLGSVLSRLRENLAQLGVKEPEP